MHIAILLDFSKAFDKVPHPCLLAKLAHYDIQGMLLDWVKDFLSIADHKCMVILAVIQLRSFQEFPMQLELSAAWDLYYRHVSSKVKLCR